MMKTENWINCLKVYFYGNDIDKWEKICKDAEEGKVPKITLRGIEYTLVRHGKWILTNKPNIYGGTTIRCSACGYEGVVAHIEDHHYCWVCGAKMEGVEK